MDADMDKFSDDTSSGAEDYLEDAKPGMKQDIAGGGVVKECLVEGSGFGRPPPGSTVSVHYKGTLESDGSVFDESHDPFTFKLGTGSVIKAWDLGVATMRKGEKSVLTCKPDYAYGAAGAPPSIPPNATLKFEVELLSWEETTDISEKKDGSLTKKIVKASEKWDKPEYESVCVVSVETLRGEPKIALGEQSVTIGEEEVSPSLEKCLESMKPGEECELYLKGSVGTEGGETAAYKVVLHSFESPPSRFNIDCPQKIEEAEKRKKRGNELYKNQLMDRALKKYKKAIEYLEDDYKATEEEKKQLSEMRVPLYTNAAAVQLFLKLNTDAVESCAQALKISSSNTKALIRRAKGNSALDNWAEAKQDLIKVLEDNPTNEEALKEMERLKKKIRAQDAKDKQKFSNLFSKLATMEEKEHKGKPAVQDEEGAGKVQEDSCCRKSACSAKGAGDK